MVFDIGRRKFNTVLGGAALAWPLAAHAELVVLKPRIGLLLAGPVEASAVAMKAFRQGLSQNGLDPEKDVELHVRDSDLTTNPERSAAELADGPSSVLIGTSLREVRALQRVAPRTPIVMVAVGDPVGVGLAASLERPGGFVTGLSDFRADYAETRLRLLLELLPGRHRFAFLHNPDAPTAKLTLEAALRLGADLIPLTVRMPDEIDRELTTATSVSIDALLVVPFPASFQKRREIGEWASKRGVPVVFGYAEYMDLPGQIAGIASFGTDLLDLYRRAAGYVTAILRGTNPSELPIRQPEKGELVLNLTAARRLGLAFPDSVIQRADHIIP